MKPVWSFCSWFVLKQRCLTVLRPQQTVEHLLDNNRVEFDQLGKSLDDFVLHREDGKTTCKQKEIAAVCGGGMHQDVQYLLQAVDDRDQEANVRHPFVVEVSDPLHQLWRWRH